MPGISSNRATDGRDRVIDIIDVGEHLADEERMVRPESPGERRSKRRQLGPELPLGEIGENVRSGRALDERGLPVDPVLCIEGKMRIRRLALTELEQFRPSKLWKLMSPARRLKAAQAFWADEHSAEQHAEAVVLMAQHLKFRPKSAAALPPDKKSRYLAGLAGVSDVLAGRLLVAYHLAEQRAMMGRFLDELQIAHDDGLITDNELKAPSAEALEDAARALAEFPGDDVALYFATLISQDPDAWAGLAKVLTSGAVGRV